MGRAPGELNRKVGGRTPRRTFLIVCEGEQTERLYFEALKRALHAAHVTLRVKPVGKDPRHVVDCARDGRTSFDEVWCVVDRDAHPAIKDALKLAARHKISVVVSFPSFEAWLLLHHCEAGACCQSADEAVSRLRKFIPDYEKSRYDADSLVKERHKAVERSRRFFKRLHTERSEEHTSTTTGALQTELCVQNPGGAPLCSFVHRLIEALEASP